MKISVTLLIPALIDLKMNKINRILLLFFKKQYRFKLLLFFSVYIFLIFFSLVTQYFYQALSAVRFLMT